ncbi:hypothetical protein EAI_02135 [Harpegnathos saltator]|uniref:Uncharacterized protein n=1 Tax=Harpegnathos saltator TaxID=610380 RepID=E2B7W5_HARSA|nr:hypothetical protein EAI_02135 [Harpegnathos saltator]
MEHFEYATPFEEKEEEQFDASGECSNNIVNNNQKYGDELFDLEMTLPQVTSQRLFSQNISKISRNNISALELKRPWTPSPLQHQSQLPDSAIKQVDNFIPAPTPIPDTKPALVSINISTVRGIDCFNTAINYFTITAIICFTTAINCFIITTAINCFNIRAIRFRLCNIKSSVCLFYKKPGKKRKIDPMESAFSQINTTLSMMAMQICSNNNRTSDNNDPDILIGKLVTAELKKTPEPRKNILRKNL